MTITIPNAALLEIAVQAVRGVGRPEGSAERDRKARENAGIPLIQSKDIL